MLAQMISYASVHPYGNLGRVIFNWEHAGLLLYIIYIILYIIYPFKQNLVSEYLNSSLANHPIFLHLHFFIYKWLMFLEVDKEFL